MMRYKSKQLNDNCRRGFRGARRLRSISGIVGDYKQRFRDRANRELRFYVGMRNFDDVLTKAGLAKTPSGKRWAHQRRIPASVLLHAVGQLRRANLERAESFDELLISIKNALESVRGIGELYEYDTALRIGAYLSKLPKRVYLHAGTRIGARALGFDPKLRSLNPRSLPLPLRKLRPHEIEDVLCIYKDWLGRA